MKSSIPELLGTLGSSIFSFFLAWEMIRRYCPRQVLDFLGKFFNKVSNFFNPNIQISIYEFLGNNLKPHDAYPIVEAYLSVNSSKTAKKLKAEKVKDSNKLVLSMDEYEKITDEFQGIQVKWVSTKVRSSQRPMPMGIFSSFEPEKRYYKLVFHKKNRDFVFGSYLEHVMKKGTEISQKNRQRKLFTNSHHKSWSYIVFEHPANFDTFAMDPEKKEAIVEDLLTFSKSKDFYARIGKAWKRGYLLYGPPGTGKSTMIAAMANLLDYDIYDLELTSVRDNTDLRRLLSETSGKSIIVIEDIDCSLDLTGQRKKKEEKKEIEKGKREESGSKVTLSGLLNFIDGLWSACGGERIIVFTTNYVEKLDPALTRRGRMDKHIELSYCCFEAFKVLAKNYLLIEEHPLFESIRLLMEVTKITPADVAENLMPKSPKEDAEKCLQNLIQALEETKKKEEMKELEKKLDEVKTEEKMKDTEETAKEKEETIEEEKQEELKKDV